jgi:hypothetical protein
MKLENIHQPASPESPAFVQLRRDLLRAEIDSSAEVARLRVFQDELDQMISISGSPRLALTQLSELLRDRLAALEVLSGRLIGALDDEAVRVSQMAALHRPTGAVGEKAGHE